MIRINDLIIQLENIREKEGDNIPCYFVTHDCMSARPLKDVLVIKKYKPAILFK